MIKLIFKDGSMLVGKIVAEALVIMIFKVGNCYFLVNKLALMDDGLIKLDS